MLVFFLLALSTAVFGMPEGGMLVPGRTGSTLLPMGAAYLRVDRQLSDSGWKREFEKLRVLGVTKVILGSVGKLSESGTQIENPAYPSVYSASGGNRDLLGWLLQLASERDMHVHIDSLESRGNWTSMPESGDLREMNRKMYREIISRYKFQKSLVGANFSIPLWLNRIWDYKKNGKTYPGNIVASEFVIDIRQLGRETGKQLVSSVSTAFNKYANAEEGMEGLTPLETGSAMNALVELAPFDLVLLQDGIGTGTVPLSELSQYMEQAGSGARMRGSEFWGMVQLYYNDLNVNPGSIIRPPHAFRPAEIGRIAEQILAIKPHAQGICMSDFGYMSDVATYEPVAASRLAAQYLAKYDSRVPLLNLLQVSNYQYVGAEPFPTFADPYGRKLINGRGVGAKTGDLSWDNEFGPEAVAGFYTSTANPEFSVVFDLGSTQTVGQIRVMHRVGGSPSGKVSSKAAVYASHDKITWVEVRQDSREFAREDDSFTAAWDVFNIHARARYFKLSLPMQSAGWYLLGEVEFYSQRNPVYSKPEIKLPELGKQNWTIGQTVEVTWNYDGPLTQANTWIVLMSVQWGGIYRLPLSAGFCGQICGQHIITKGAVTANGNNSYRFKMPELPGAYWVVLLTEGPGNIILRGESEYVVDVDYLPRNW